MITATWTGTGPPVWIDSSNPEGVATSSTLDLQHFLFLDLEELVDLGDVLVGQFLDSLRLALGIVLAELMLVLPALGFLVGFLSRMTHRHPPVLRLPVQQ